VNSCKLFSAFGKFDGVEIVAQGYLPNIGLNFNSFHLPSICNGKCYKGEQIFKVI